MMRRRQKVVKRKGIMMGIKEVKKGRRHQRQLKSRVNQQPKRRKSTANVVMHSATVGNNLKLSLTSISTFNESTKLHGCVAGQTGLNQWKVMKGIGKIARKFVLNGIPSGATSTGSTKADITITAS